MLQKVRKDYEAAQKNPLSVVLSSAKFPVSLIQQPKARRMHLLSADSFENTFGPKAQRKRPKLMLELTQSKQDDDELPFTSFPSAEPAPEPTEEDTMQLFMESTLNKQSIPPESLFLYFFYFCLFLEKYQVESDPHLAREEDFKEATRHSMFDKGQSKRIWTELYKVIDSSDVIAVVLDARDPYGTRARHVEKYLRENSPHKHLFFILNKCDLVPQWALVCLHFLFHTLTFVYSVNISISSQRNIPHSPSMPTLLVRSAKMLSSNYFPSFMSSIKKNRSISVLG